MKNLKYLFIFFFLLSCGYTPIYQTDQNSKIRLDKINYSGDKKLTPWKKIAKKLDLSIQGCINIHNKHLTEIKKYV